MSYEMKVLFTKEDIAERVAELGKRLSEDYKGKNPLFVCVLKGAFVFAADLARSFDGECELEFIRVKSYCGKESSGNLTLLCDVSADVRGRYVVFVEDILDTGVTLFGLKRLFSDRGCADVKTAVLLDKPLRRVADISADYAGFSIEDRFVVGYGLDFDEKYRYLPYIAALD